ncbi:hypothetical protein KMZ32_14080 [Phycicoccus sp. MAQZ13P-2]|uniref:hypothetical protein n=1 Tax=Phycicoccus mangrovi TaxID=2840470 RepID=UPI001BFFEBC8|nr:hypothetical protein [Phycicoccus mangrovi]MBT9256553.1 hypothetical protein [Phycicoccus mangrovi]MBT9275201.1 hypothetical protein [Phycicoccus mangrovi]
MSAEGRTDGPPLLPGGTLPGPLQTHLRRSLEVLRDRADDAGVRRRIEDVLAGRAALRDLAGDDGFSAFAAPLVEQGLRRLDELGPQEREQLALDAAALGRGEVPPHLREDGDASAVGPARDDRPPAPPRSPGTW